MPKTGLSDEDFIREFERLGATEFAAVYNTSVRGAFKRRKELEQSASIAIEAPAGIASRYGYYERRIPITLNNGCAIIGSDPHYWPGDPTPAHRGMVKLIKDLSPKFVLLNGDVVDGACISRHPPIGWNGGPSLKEEFEACSERLSEIQKAANGAACYWSIGNHDLRFESTLAARCKEIDGIPGARLCDHFPGWKIGWSFWVNGNVVIKHRFKGGVHATHNNTLWAGKSIVTGHLHSLKITPFSDYNGHRYGVDTGALSDPYGEHAHYNEDSPLNHRSGFIVLTFHNSELLLPEIAAVYNENSIQFRGKVIDI